VNISRLDATSTRNSSRHIHKTDFFWTTSILHLDCFGVFFCGIFQAQLALRLHFFVNSSVCFSANNRYIAQFELEILSTAIPLALEASIGPQYV